MAAVQYSTSLMKSIWPKLFIKVSANQECMHCICNCQMDMLDWSNPIGGIGTRGANVISIVLKQLADLRVTVQLTP